MNSKGTDGIINEDAQDILAHIEGVTRDSEFAKTLDDEVKRVKSNENWRAEYVKQNVNDVLKFRQGREEGRLEGLEEGRLEEKVAIVKNLLNTTSLTFEEISKATKLTILEIEEIKSKIQ